MPRNEPDFNPLSPARMRLRDAAKAARMSLKEISLAIGRNHSYLQQFMARGSPKFLPETEREAIAHILGLQPDDLRDHDRPLPPVASTIARQQDQARPAGRRVPLIIEGREREAPGSIALAELHGGDPTPDARVLRLSRALGIFQPRTMLLLDPTAPVRIGDFAALAEGGTIRAIGLAAPHPENRPAILAADGKTITAMSTDASLWRIEAIRPA